MLCRDYHQHGEQVSFNAGCYLQDHLLQLPRFEGTHIHIYRSKCGFGLLSSNGHSESLDVNVCIGQMSVVILKP
jgi:hypothetical protein